MAAKYDLDDNSQVDELTLLSHKKITVRQRNPGPYSDDGMDRKKRVAQFNRSTDERRKVMDAKTKQR